MQEELAQAAGFRVLLLGPFVLERDNVAIDVSTWQRRVSSLFKLLATAPDLKCSRDDLIEALWPETSPDAGANNLRTLAHRLRAALGGGEPLPVLAEHGWISLNPQYKWEIDYHQFEALADAAHDIPSLERVLALYRSEPLAEERYQDWAIAKRDHLQNTWRSLCLRLATVYQMDDALDEATRVLERLLEADPLDEEAIRELLTVLYHAGKPADALRRYHRFEQLLASELGVLPSAATMAVVQQLHTESVPVGTDTPRPGLSLPIGGFLGAVPEYPMVAREEELKRVLLVTDIVERGRGQVVFVSGERGVGKTRLVQEVMLHLHTRGFLVAVGRCHERQNALPLYPFLDAVEQALHDARPQLQSDLACRFPALIPAVPEDPAGAVEADVAVTPRSNDGNSGLESPAMLERLDPRDRYGIFRDITGFFTALAEDRPVAVLLDDLQWADEESFNLLLHLASRTRSHRVLFLGTYRDFAAGQGHTLGRVVLELAREALVERVSLHRLPEEGTAQLVKATVGEMDASEEFADFVHRRTRGNPYFIHQVLEALGGRYSLIRHIGSGGMGRVFEAIDTSTGDTVAAKIMFARAEADPKAILRFEQEGAILARLKHPNLVKVHGTFLAEHVNCIIMELINGQSLSALLRAGKLPLDRIKDIVEQVASALICAHSQGIVHRDIKPDNIMVLSGDQVKVTDFGIARLIRPPDTGTDMTSTGMTLGTPLYMAPEQIEGRRLDGRADIYSLGAVLYLMVTGRPPFDGHDPISIAFKHVHQAPQPPVETNAGLPDDWNRLILKALAKDPADRYQTSNSLKEALASLSTQSESVLVSAAAGTGGPAVALKPPEPGETADVQTEYASIAEVPTDRRSHLGFLKSRWTALASAITALMLVLAGITIRVIHTSTSGHGAQILILGMKGSLPGQFDKPMGVDVDQQDAIVVVDSLNERIQKFPVHGSKAVSVLDTSASALGSLFRPHDVAVSPKGNVYVADMYNDRIEMFAPSGKVLASGSSGPNAGEFARPTGLSLDSRGNVYVADSLNSRVQKLSPSLEFIAQWTVPGPNPGTQSRPSEIALDGSGDIYVADFQNNRIVELAPDGHLIRTWGTAGNKPGQLMQPASVFLDAQGNLYIADWGNNRVQELSVTGKVVKIWGHLNKPADITLDRFGNLYVADSQNNRVVKLSPDGALVASWGSKGNGPGQLDDPEGVSVDSSGRLYVADSQNDVIRRFSPNGGLLPDLGILSSDRLSGPHGLAIDAEGNIFLADTLHDRIEEVSPKGAFLGSWGASGSGPGQLIAPWDVAVDTVGNLYVADTGNNRIQKLQAGKRRTWRVIGRSIRPNGIALDGQGHIYVAESGTNRVQVFSKDGKVLQLWGAKQSLKHPRDIALDGAGDVYVADTGNSRILEFSGRGVLIQRWGVIGSHPGQFRRPVGVTIDRQGNIIVADTGNNRIQVISRPS